MAQILVTRPGVLTARDKSALRKSGVVPIEADEPNDVRLVQTEGPTLQADDMLGAALSALARNGNSYDLRAAFVKALSDSMNRRIAEQDATS